MLTGPHADSARNQLKISVLRNPAAERITRAQTAPFLHDHIFNSANEHCAPACTSPQGEWSRDMLEPRHNSTLAYGFAQAGVSPRSSIVMRPCRHCRMPELTLDSPHVAPRQAAGLVARRDQEPAVLSRRGCMPGICFGCCSVVIG
jgi:hypothetical protein